MTKPNFYDLMKKEKELLERLEKIIDKLESPILTFPDTVNNSETQININKIFNGEPVIIPEPDYLRVNFSPFTHLPVSIETDTHFYYIEVKNSLIKEEWKWQKKKLLWN